MVEIGLDDPRLEALQRLHERLETHFQTVRAQRDKSGRGKPIFALEHGLVESEIEGLRLVVRQSLKDRGLSNRWWLPWVVYAAEIGYRYTGDEYWQTFEATTPEWLVRGDRHYIRRRFQEFTKLFGGAQPAGPWADHFSIICWPITHSVLPTDLQVQLARLLYDYRRSLTPQLVAKPDELGQKLSAGVWGRSSRFQNFAQNASLLGLVAAALLLGEESKSALLLESTLARIVSDLSRERQARRWLGDAKSSASRIDLRGLAPVGSGATHRAEPSTEPRQPRPRTVAEPSLFLVPAKDSGWALMVELPDLAPLAAQSEDLRHALSNSRCVVVGSNRPPLARGQILYPGQKAQLDKWPGKGAPLLRLEKQDARIDGILADECRVSAGPVWLFRLREDMSAEEVRGRATRPGQRYVVLSQVPFDGPQPSWLEPTVVECEGLHATQFHVPTVVAHADVGFLEALGLFVLSELEVRPIGLVPSAWDSESFAEWVEGDCPMVAVSATTRIDHVALSLDDAPLVRFEWPTDARRVCLSLGALNAGGHQLRVVVAPTGAPELISGTLAIAIREPRVSEMTGSYREPLVLLAHPAFPTLGEIWDGRASLEVLGPPGAVISTSVALDRGAISPPVKRELRELQLPVGGDAWRQTFDNDFRQRISRMYDDAVACVITVSNPDLGSTSLRAEREFAPLRWGVGEDHEGPYARLHDNLGDPALAIERFAFSTPATAFRVATDSGTKLRFEAGGLFVARVQKFNAGVVLPPLVRDLGSLARAQVRPKIAAFIPPDTISRQWMWQGNHAVLVTKEAFTASEERRRIDRILTLVSVARMWASASLPGSPLAAIPRNSVLRATAAALSSAIVGERWSVLEERIEDGDLAALRELGSAIGKSVLQRAPWMTVERLAERAASISIEQRVADLAGSLRELAPTVGPPGDGRLLAEALLRLASSPETAVLSGRGEVDVVSCAVQSPLAFAAARLVVLATHLGSTEPGQLAPYRGWDWE